MLFKNKINWEKKGLVIKPNKKLYSQKSHAMIPTPEYLRDDIYRIYYSGRNKLNQSIISCSDIKLTNDVHVIKHHSKPILLPGSLGCFDDNGVTPSCVINLKDNKKGLYYIGWNPGSTVRMHLFGGLAISNANRMSFKRFSRAPIIERSLTDPFLNTAPWVVRNKNKFIMYYVSGSEWKNKNLPRYNIKIATSNDGKNWNRNGLIAIDYKDRYENALARPFVLKDNNIWKMWFSCKGKKYRIGYAESLDGIKWVRNDNFANINTSKGSFDSDMIEYPAIIKFKNKFYMFYNGNNYGYNGIGLAIGTQ